MIIFRYIIITLTLLVTACSIAPPASEMIPDDLAFTKHHPYTISLDIKGDEGNWDTLELINSDELTTAIETSIIKSGVFSKVVKGSAYDYRLIINTDVSAPAAGFNMTVKIGGTWQLFKVSTNKVVMDNFITVSHTATVGEAFSGAKRLQLALSGAARKFIAEGIRHMEKLNL